MDQVPQTESEPPLAFTAERWPFLKILLVNALLTVLTLGIYRFWAKTRVRRYLWENVHFLGDPMEYTGTAKELLIGFLIVLAILFPLGLIYNAISLLVPPDILWLRITLEVTYFLTLFGLIQIAFYRAWRYRMSRTAWRGIRFGLDGSTATYLKLAAGWSVLTFITLGLANPWMQVDLWRYQIQHTRIGVERFKFEGDPKELLVPWLIASVPGYVIIALFAAAAWKFGDVFASNPQQAPGVVFGDPATEVALWIMGLAYAASPILYLWYSVRLTRLQISGLEVGNTAFYSALPFARLLGFAGLALFATALFIGLLAGLAILLFVVTGYSGEFGQAFMPVFLIIMVLIFMPLFWTVIFRFETLKQTVLTMEIINPHALQTVAQSAKEGPKTGEGLADALDVGGL